MSRIVMYALLPILAFYVAMEFYELVLYYRVEIGSSALMQVLTK